MLINHHGSTYIERMYMAGGQYERDHLPDGSWRNLTYITTPAGLSAVFIQNEGSQEEEFYFIHTDYHGSIMALTDYNGQLLEEYSYDPWGNRRYPETWENMYTNTTNPTAGQSGSQSLLWGVGGALFRGYTFHEHLDCFALINMNGRMYDPVLGRMLSADNYMHSGTQGLNRYAYVYSNPLKYTDPSGEIIHIVVGVVIGAYIGGAMANDNMHPLQWDFSNPNTWIGMGVGGLIGGFGGYALGAAKGSSLSFFGKTNSAAAAAGKKYFGATVGGMTNTITNYDGADSFGWGTLADFGAGFGGSYAGLATGSWAAGFNAGGFLNATSNMIQDGVQGPIQFAQDWVGGGLSSTLGMKYGKLSSVFTPFGSSSKLANFSNKFVNNGLAANAWDFAYSDWDKYRKKSWGEHLALFAVAGATATAFETVMKPANISSSNSLSKWQKARQYIDRGISGAGFGIMGYNLDGLVKNGTYFYSKGSQQNKAEQMSFKWLLTLIKP
jgi:RHS repeat-associated protein